MNKRRPLLAALALAVSAIAAQAQTNAYWDVDGTNSSNLGGSGTWSSTGVFWTTNPLGATANSNGPAGGALFAVATAAAGSASNASGAFTFNFGTTNGTVKLGGAFQAYGVNIQASGYTFWVDAVAARTLTLTNGFALGGNTITFSNGPTGLNSFTFAGPASTGWTNVSNGITADPGAGIVIANTGNTTNLGFYISSGGSLSSNAPINILSAANTRVMLGSQSSGGASFNSAITNNSAGGSPLELTNSSSGTLNFNGVVSGANGLILNNSSSGRISLNAANTYGGGTTLNNTGSGTLQISNASAFGTGMITSAGSGVTNFVRAEMSGLDITNNWVINSGSTLRLSANNSGWNVTASGEISGPGSMLFSNSGVNYRLSGTNNSFAGGVVVGNGTLYFNTMGLAGSNSSLGTNGVLQTGGGTTTGGFRWTNLVSEASDKTINLNGSTGGVQILADSATVNASLTLNGNIVSTVVGNKTITLAAYSTNNSSSSNSLIVNGVIGEFAGSINNVVVGASSTGTVELGNTNNSFSGGVRLTNSTASQTTTLSLAKLGDAGTASPVGTNGTISMGGISNSTVVLRFTGVGEDFGNRTINLVGAAGSISGIDQSGSGNLRLTNPFTSSVAANRTIRIQGSTAGTGELAFDLGDIGGGVISLTKSGTGTWTLSGNNTYSGLTTISGSTNAVLKFATVNSLSPNTSLAGSSSTAGTATMELSTAGNYVLNSYGTATTAGNNIAFAAVQPGTTLTFTNATNTVTSSSGTSAGRSILNNSTNLAMTFSGAIDIGSSSTNEAEFGAVGDIAVNGSIFNTNTGVRGLTKSGNGVLSLNASNSYNGTTTVNAGTLRLGNANALGTTSAGTVVASGATIDLNGQAIAGEALTIQGNGINTNGALFNSSSAAASWSGAVSLTNDTTIGVTNGSITISGNIGQTGSGKNLTKVGAGTLFLSGSNSYSGLTTMNGGTIQVSSPNALAAASALAGSGSANITNVLRLAAAGSYTMDSVQVPGLMMIEGPGSGSTTLTFTNGGSMSGNSDKTISAGSGVTINVNGASFDTGNPGSGIRDLGISGNGNTVFNAAIVSTNSSTVNATRLFKEGAGTVTLNGANTYLGSTVINSGVLELGSSGSLRFFAGASGVNNAVSGAGSAVLGGTVNIDLSAAATNSGSSWALVSVTSPSYPGSFNVAGFTNSGGTWSRGTNGVTYQFSQSTGVLSILSTNAASGYTAWLTNYPSLVNTNGTGDPDGDGFDNNMEFAFDGNPTVGSPAMISAASSSAGTVFSFLASTNTSAVTYVVQSTSDLSAVPWADNSGVTASITNSSNQANVPLAPSYVRREFTVTPAGSKFFYRVKATIAP
jgi:autotransporter-associated beta strand protein